MKYYLSPNAVKDLRRFEIADRRRIIEKLGFYTAAKDPLAFAKRLSDPKFGEYRFRIGEYRAIFDVRSEVGIVILAIGKRGDIYR
jgi:mRNA-degrading endonuclease RelE of RelBE toxin-antitoxin system